LEAEVMKLRAVVIARDSALAWERDNYAMLEAAMPGLERRANMARHIHTLQRRIDELVRERNQRQTNVQPHFLHSQLGQAWPAADLQARSVLCVGRDEVVATLTQRLIEKVGGRFSLHDGVDDKALETSMVDADLVICQTGCVSHGAYWRVKEHCLRTGKQCVLVEHPNVLDRVRARRTAGANVALVQETDKRSK